ncbi:MAG: hypothetical protein AB7S67_02815 [Thiomonas sp.]
MVAALGPVARSYLSKYIDPADAWLAEQEGLFHKQARSRARNAARCLGGSWPDRLPAGALIDPAEAAETQHSCGFHALAPDQILEALEAGIAALGGADGARMLAQADAREVDTRALADMSGLTQRRARQIKSLRVARAAVQMPLFTGEGDEEGGEQ